MVEVKARRSLSPEKADAILGGAMEEFLVHGYAAATMDRVATAAGVSKATVYSHFGDKESLFAALVKQMAQQKIAALFDPQRLQGDPRQVLPALLSKALDQVTCDAQHLAFIRLIIGESGRFPQLAQIFVRHLSKPGLDLLSQYLAVQPYLKFADPEATARIVVGTIVYYVQTQEMLHGKEIIPMEKERLLKTLTQLVLNSAEPLVEGINDAGAPERSG
jgi:TetR/AcrR family transcriptional regulator, regulator of autoinduction and epiphytic fitness